MDLSLGILKLFFRNAGFEPKLQIRFFTVDFTGGKNQP